MDKFASVCVLMVCYCTVGLDSRLDCWFEIISEEAWILGASTGLELRVLSLSLISGHGICCTLLLAALRSVLFPMASFDLAFLGLLSWFGRKWIKGHYFLCSRSLEPKFIFY